MFQLVGAHRAALEAENELRAWQEGKVPIGATPLHEIEQLLENAQYTAERRTARANKLAEKADALFRELLDA